MTKDPRLMNNEEIQDANEFFQLWFPRAKVIERAAAEQLMAHAHATGVMIERTGKLETALQILLDNAYSVKRKTKNFLYVIELCDRILLGEELSRADREWIEAAQAKKEKIDD